MPKRGFNLGTYKVYVKQLGLASFDGVLIMRGNDAVAGAPLVKAIRPMAGDTITIRFESEESARATGK